MHNGLAERTIGLAVVDRCFTCSRRDLGDAGRRFGVDMSLGDKGLQREGKHGDEHDKASPLAEASHSKQFCRQSCHRACNRLNSTSLCRIGHPSATGRCEFGVAAAQRDRALNWLRIANKVLRGNTPSAGVEEIGDFRLQTAGNLGFPT